MNINWILIKEKYPKAINKFLYYISFIDFNSSFRWFEIMQNKEYNFILYYNGENEASKFEMSFEMLYGIIEKFFDEQGIIITSFFDYKDKKFNYEIYLYEIENNITSGTEYYFNRDEAKKEVIYLAFEILEDKL